MTGLRPNAAWMTSGGGKKRPKGANGKKFTLELF